MVKYAPPITTLENVKQKNEECLTSYFKRFNTESTIMTGAPNKALKSFLIAGLCVGTNLWKHLRRKDPATLADVFEQSESFKIAEQSLTDNRKTDTQGNQKGR